jgi:hypothetical protein
VIVRLHVDSNQPDTIRVAIISDNKCVFTYQFRPDLLIDGMENLVGSSDSSVWIEPVHRWTNKICIHFETSNISAKALLPRSKVDRFVAAMKDVLGINGENESAS